jgi:D-amino peptidase
MRVYVSIDMEGVAGIVTAEQCRVGAYEYPLSQQLMTDEANAAIEGAFLGGATEVTVSDGHGRLTNLLQSSLDARALLVNGSPRSLHGMMQGIDAGFDVAFCIGYHAAAGLERAVRAHTYSGATIYEVRVNGTRLSELGLNSMIAASQGVPVVLVTGDDAICRTAADALGARTVVVKDALGVASAVSVHPERARALIRDAATEAVAAGPLPLVDVVPEKPYLLEVDLHYLEMAEVCELIPGAARSGRTVSLQCNDVATLARAVMAFVHLAAAAPGPGRLS